MSQPAITEALVEQVISRKKFIQRVVFNNTRIHFEEPNEKRIVYEVRFADMREKDAGLQLVARLEKALSGVFPRPQPGLSLRLRGQRIRGINWNLRHGCQSNGVNTGFVKGWHEKLWTNLDADKYIVDINGEVRNTDLMSMIRFACQRWNVELPADQPRLGDL